MKKGTHLPITDFPVSPKLEDKTGCIVVWERPDEKPAWGTYYGSIDPVGEGKTITSESLCSERSMVNRSGKKLLYALIISLNY